MKLVTHLLALAVVIISANGRPVINSQCYSCNYDSPISFTSYQDKLMIENAFKTNAFNKQFLNRRKRDTPEEKFADSDYIIESTTESTKQLNSFKTNQTDITIEASVMKQFVDLANKLSLKKEKHGDDLDYTKMVLSLDINIPENITDQESMMNYEMVKLVNPIAYDYLTTLIKEQIYKNSTLSDTVLHKISKFMFEISLIKKKYGDKTDVSNWDISILIPRIDETDTISTSTTETYSVTESSFTTFIDSSNTSDFSLGEYTTTYTPPTELLTAETQFINSQPTETDIPKIIDSISTVISTSSSPTTTVISSSSSPITAVISSSSSPMSTEHSQSSHNPDDFTTPSIRTDSSSSSHPIKTEDVTIHSVSSEASSTSSAIKNEDVIVTLISTAVPTTLSSDQSISTETSSTLFVISDDNGNKIDGNITDSNMQEVVESPNDQEIITTFTSIRDYLKTISKRTWIICGASVGTLVMVVCLGFIIPTCYKKYKRMTYKHKLEEDAFYRGPVGNISMFNTTASSCVAGSSTMVTHKQPSYSLFPDRIQSNRTNSSCARNTSMVVPMQLPCINTLPLGIQSNGIPMATFKSGNKIGCFSTFETSSFGIRRVPRILDFESDFSNASETDENIQIETISHVDESNDLPNNTRDNNNGKYRLSIQIGGEDVGPNQFTLNDDRHSVDGISSMSLSRESSSSDNHVTVLSIKELAEPISVGFSHRYTDQNESHSPSSSSSALPSLSNTSSPCPSTALLQSSPSPDLPSSSDSDYNSREEVFSVNL